jgi:hypothetical protein
LATAALASLQLETNRIANTEDGGATSTVTTNTAACPVDELKEKRTAHTDDGAGARPPAANTPATLADFTIPQLPPELWRMIGNFLLRRDWHGALRISIATNPFPPFLRSMMLVFRGKHLR